MVNLGHFVVNLGQSTIMLISPLLFDFNQIFLFVIILNSFSCILNDN